MNSTRRPATLLFGLSFALSFGLLFSVPAAASTVYKTVDADGNVSFSDTPPADGREAQEMQIETAPPADDAVYQQRLEAMRESTDRMAADRREREKHRAELRQQQAEAQQPAYYPVPTPTYDYLPYGGGYPVYIQRPGHARPGHVRPGHVRPPVRPPQQPPEGIRSNLYNNSQLMRPMLPRSR